MYQTYCDICLANYGFAKMKLGTNITTSQTGRVIAKLSLKKIINLLCSHAAQHSLHLTP